MQHYLIIGASSGIGLELAMQLAESSKQVIATFNKNKTTAANPPADDIANMAAFLLSEKASWITGQIFHVDGGMSAIKI